MRERKRNRKLGFNYNKDGFYFITSCIQNRIHHFGYVRNGVMRLNVFGRIAEKQWHWLGLQYPYVILHAFVAMPNHVHGILEINRSMIDRPDAPLPIFPDVFNVPDFPDFPNVGASRDLPLHLENRENRGKSENPKNHEQPVPTKIKSLSQLIGAYKTTTSKQIHLAGLKEFEWQRSFHDHIIRDNTAYWNIYDYIANNPKKWKEDCFFDSNNYR